MELRLQPKPEVEILPANQGIVSRKQFFVNKQFEKINQYFFPAHFIRNWKPKAELLYPSVSDESAIQYECDFNRDIQNCFVEDNAEEVFLRTPPPCFVVFGKYGESVSKLSKKLADEFGSVLIQVDDIINQLLQAPTETSKTLDRLLRFGVSLTLNFILALSSYVAHTAEARHRGYVLCGLPCIPESYDLPVEQQLNYLFTWDNKPTVFINVLFDDEDLIKERTSLRCEIGNLGLGNFIVFHTEDFVEGENVVGEDFDEKPQPAAEETSYVRDIDVSPSQPWVQLPRDEESQVWPELELFDIKIRPAIKLIISRVDPQYFITVDSRLENEFDIVLARLSLLQIWKVPVAVPFISPKRHKAVSKKSSSLKNLESEVEEEEKEQSLAEDDEVDADIKQAAKEPPETAFLTLFAKNTISPKFRWELSHYNYICPVTLREGELIEGKSEFAVAFMKYIYFLRNEESMLKFIQNPRPYVLPIRPEPPCRFIILGYPYSLKTSVAKTLSNDFSIPLIDANNILRNDLDRKKNIYQEFCRQKAECREIVRLNAQAWQDWRMEEEHRITLIEEWVAYIQTLLTQRIEHFYCRGESDGMSIQSKEIHVQEYSPAESSENVQLMPLGSLRSEESSREGLAQTSTEVCGMVLNEATSGPAQESSPSSKIIKALRHEDFDFNDPYLEVDANLFFSSLWNTFSNEDHQRDSSGSISKAEELGEGPVNVTDMEEENAPVNWCSLLPPQSLSSFLMNKIPTTMREKRQSFKIFLEAASKAYWTPCKLKTEFAKWRLPCFMDIPLCEIFLDNPIMLLKYVPEWLKERPLVPYPVEPTHPCVLEAGRTAFLRAGVVTIKQNKEEIAVLLRDAIEKAERERMRVTGEVISPGGWVVDNMTLDLDVWKKLACEGIFADHIYILLDTEPEHRRIMNTWCELNRTSLDDWEFSENENQEEEESEEYWEERENVKEPQPVTRNLSKLSRKERSGESEQENLVETLKEIVKLNAQDDYQLDEIFDRLLDDSEPNKGFVPPMSVDAFSHHMFQNTVETWSELKEETANEEALMTVQTLTHCSGGSFFNRQILSPLQNCPLGSQLQRFGKAILNSFKKREDKVEERQREKQSLTESVQFFISLLTLPKKIQDLKDWLTSAGRGTSVTEIDITDRDLISVMYRIRKALLEKFIKKPRELLDFEKEEIQKSERRQKRMLDPDPEDSDDGEADEEEEEEEKGGGGEAGGEEDMRIFGECGPLCIVNLERDIFLLGKPEFALRYYGKLYYFWNEIAKNKFIYNPEKYAPYYSVIRCYPPLRIFITGPIGSGKTSLGDSIAKQCNLAFVNYSKLLLRNLVPHLDTTFEKYSTFGEFKLLLSEDYNAAAKLLKEKFMNAPYKIRQFWFENPVYEDLLETKNKFKSKLIDLNKPLIPKNFPELNYECIESVPDDKNGEDPPPLSSSPQDFFVSMAEIESNINAYFQATAELTDYCIEKTMKVLWTTEPYLSQGFVLKGFPLRACDAKQVIENNWIPDLVFDVELPSDLVVSRNIDSLMESWDAQLKHEVIEERLLQDTLSSIQRICMRFRRNELLAQKRQKELLQSEQLLLREKPVVTVVSQEEEMLIGKREIKKSASSLSPVVEERIQGEVDAILKDEFPSLSFNPSFETYNMGKARITENLLKCHRRDTSEIEKLKSTFKDLGVPWVTIDSTKNMKENLTKAFLILDKARKRVGFKGEFAFTVKMETAEKLLRQGYYFLSKFGRWCPVQVYRMKNPIHMFRPLSAKGKVTPVAYRNYIYFVGGENEKQKFIEDPVKYTFNEPHHPNIPLRVAIIGPPKCGKSTLSNRLGRTFDMKVVTMGSALRFVLEKMPKSTLAKSINNYLKRGCFLPLSFKVEALTACLNDPSCVTQGFVFDGIPFDAALTQSLAEKGKLPFVIISLVAEPDFGKTNRQNLDLTEFRLPYKNRINLNSRYRDWNDTYKRFAQWNQNTYNNLYEVNAKLSVVDIFYRAYDIIRKSFFGILYYVEYCVSDRALPLHHLCVGQHEYELRKSSFHNNCPVCWVEENKLSSCSNPPPRSGLVQYLNYFYWICSKHMEKFLKIPKMYVPPKAPPVPHPLPKRITKAKYESTSSSLKIHGFGRCPVTKVDFPGVLDWEGSWDFAALYANKVFLCKNKEMLDRFLSRPWKYCKANTEFETNPTQKSKAIEELGPPKVTSLPPIGFLEQTVADSIHECLQILGSVRPVFPNMTPATTGCTFVALYLKVHNKRNKVTDLERHYLEFMLHHCKAYMFRVPPFKRPASEIDTFQEDTVSSESSEEEETEFSSRVSGMHSAEGDQTSWLDLEAQADKKMWSAKVQRADVVRMRLTSYDELLEIPEVPKTQVVLRYQTYGLRSSPLPPVSNCLTFVYSVAPALEIREKFNYNTLYQPLSMFPSPYAQTFIFNPEKEFACSLFERSQTEFQSQQNLWQSKRTHSDQTFDPPDPPKHISELDSNLETILKLFIPRFQLLDTLTSVKVPSAPKVVQEDPIIFNPHRDYAYTLLLSEFFHTTHVLRCFEWDECHQQLERSNILDRNLGLSSVQVEYFLHPQRPSSAVTRKSIDSYMEAFDHASLFVTPSSSHPPIKVCDPACHELEQLSRAKSSLINFVQMIILEKLDELFTRVSLGALSYDSYEISLTRTESEVNEKQISIMIREILPYPPLPWDIVSRPYYAYTSLPSIFRQPVLDNIAHERHFSLLDGIMEPNDEIRFVRYPSWVHRKQENQKLKNEHKVPKKRKNVEPMSKTIYLVYDFFNLHWTSFLTYPFSWAYNKDLTGNFCEFHSNTDSPLCAEKLADEMN